MKTSLPERAAERQCEGKGEKMYINLALPYLTYKPQFTKIEGNLFSEVPLKLTNYFTSMMDSSHISGAS